MSDEKLKLLNEQQFMDAGMLMHMAVLDSVLASRERRLPVFTAEELMEIVQLIAETNPEDFFAGPVDDADQHPDEVVAPLTRGDMLLGSLTRNNKTGKVVFQCSAHTDAFINAIRLANKLLNE